jgi:polygalacturonase
MRKTLTLVLATLAIIATVVAPFLAPLLPAHVGELMETPPALAAAAQTTINVAMYGTRGDGTTADQAAILAAANALPSTGGWLSFPPGNYKITASLSLPSKARLVFANGAKITIAASVTLTIAGTVQAGNDQQIFAITSLAATPVTFTGVSVGPISPRWFGALGDDSTDDLTPFKAALLSRAGAHVLVPPGVYALSDTLVIAGKGHETGQIIGSHSHPFSDQDTVRTLLAP